MKNTAVVRVFPSPKTWILEAAGIEQKGLHSIRHTFATTLVNGIKQPDGTIRSLTPRQVANLLGHSTSEITEMYYVKRDNTQLVGITDGFALRLAVIDRGAIKDYNIGYAHERRK